MIIKIENECHRNNIDKKNLFEYTAKQIINVI